MRQWLSHTIVWHRVGSLGVQLKPGWLGLPVRAKFAQAVAIFLTSVCASGVLPGEVVLVHRWSLLFVFQPDHALDVIARADAIRTIGQEVNAPARVRLFLGGDEGCRLALSHAPGERDMPLRLGGPGRHSS